MYTNGRTSHLAGAPVSVSAQQHPGGESPCLPLAPSQPVDLTFLTLSNPLIPRFSTPLHGNQIFFDMRLFLHRRFGSFPATPPRGAFALTPANLIIIRYLSHSGKG